MVINIIYFVFDVGKYELCASHPDLKVETRGTPEVCFNYLLIVSLDYVILLKQSILCIHFY